MNGWKPLRVGMGIFAVSVIVSAVGWFSLGADAEVPIHVGARGVDRWVGRTEAVVSVPTGMLVVLLVGMRRSRREREAAGGAEAWLILAALTMLAMLNAVVVTGSLGQPGAGEIVLTLGVSGLLLAVSQFCRRRNRTAGSAWGRGYRVAARGFVVLAGLVLVVTPAADLRRALMIAIAGSVLVGLSLLIVIHRPTAAGPPSGPRARGRDRSRRKR